MLANLIETGFLPSHLTALLEYGVPPSAIRKIAPHIKQEISHEELVGVIKSMNIEKMGLLAYEVNKLRNL